MLKDKVVTMTGRERMLRVLRGEEVDRVPVWLMRQAGRYLPEYRAMKEKYTFLEMVKAPELACEVTLMPMKRFNFDAAIIFSDILVVPEAMGQGYSFKEGGGIQMQGTIDSEAKIEKLQGGGMEEKLQYVGEAIRLVKKELGGGVEKAVLGFGGSPWTLATYMVGGGGGTKDFGKLLSLAYSQKPLFEILMKKLVDALKRYFKMLVESGVDAIQIFDSWGGGCSGAHYWEFSLKWIKEIIDDLKGRVPVILFTKGMGCHYEDMVNTNATVLGFDWTVKMGEMASKIPARVGLQGNLDPLVLTMEKEVVREETKRLLREMQGRHGYIFNLGHGITPEAKIENVEVLMEVIEGYGTQKAFF